MLFVTGCFGAEYLKWGTALRRTFADAMPGEELYVWSDDETVASDWCCRSMESLLDEVAPFDWHRAHRRKVFKFPLVRAMLHRHKTDICWLDANLSVLSDLRPHLQPGVPNLICHGRRGNNRFPIGCLWSLPPGEHIDRLFSMTKTRSDNGPLGDQPILQSWAASGINAHWPTDDRRFIFNMELGSGLHPRVGDPRLTQIVETPDRQWSLDQRTIVTIAFTSHRLREHTADQFRSFSPPIRAYLRDLYARTDTAAAS